MASDLRRSHFPKFDLRKRGLERSDLGDIDDRLYQGFGVTSHIPPKTASDLRTSHVMYTLAVGCDECDPPIGGGSHITQPPTALIRHTSKSAPRRRAQTVKKGQTGQAEPASYWGRCDAPGCGVSVAWTVNVYTGKPLAVDWVPDPDGNVAVQADGDRLISRVMTAGSKPRPGEQAAWPHAVTCPASRVVGHNLDGRGKNA